VITDCTALVMAGGMSRRMGRDKAGLVLEGRSLLHSVTKVMQMAFPEILLSVRHIRPEIDLAQVEDDPSCAGPVAGLLAGLAAASTPWVFAIACDMPFIAPEVIGYLSQRRKNRQAVVPVVGGHPQPLAAFYSSGCVTDVRSHLNSQGKASMLAVLEHLDVCYVDEAELLAVDPTLRSFFDLDTPQDVEQAKHMGRIG
jgi:molybdopterin-guanine dinucleotide biosynthesis protein A